MTEPTTRRGFLASLAGAMSVCIGMRRNAPACTAGRVICKGTATGTIPEGTLFATCGDRTVELVPAWTAEDGALWVRPDGPRITSAWQGHRLESADDLLDPSRVRVSPIPLANPVI